MNLVIQNQTIPVRIAYFRKKNSSAVYKNGEILLRIASHLRPAERERHIGELLEKMRRKLGRAALAAEQSAPPLADGMLFDWFGDRYMLHLSLDNAAVEARVKVVRRSVLLTLPLAEAGRPSDASLKRLRQALGKALQPQLDQFVRHLNARTLNSQKLGSVRFPEQQSRWGSCSGRGNINISTRLLFLPFDLLEYVCLHELCHLREMNHSDRYWQLVETHMPDYRERQKRLRQRL